MHWRWKPLLQQQPKQQEQCPKTFSIASYNSSSWQSAKGYLQDTRADVVLLQESHVLAHAADETSAAARRLGWKLIQSVASPGKGTGSSGGVMILAKDWIGLSAPEGGGPVLIEGRAVAAVVECPGFFPLAVVSVYLWCGQGLSSTNLEILEAVGAFQASQSLPIVVGGDFQFGPAVMAIAGFGLKMQAMVVSSQESLGSCKNQLGDMATIDFFVVSRCFKKPLINCKVDLEVDPHPHRPVVLSFSLSKQDQTFLAFQKPPDTPVVKGREVEQEGGQWESALDMISQLLACKPREVTDEMLFEAYGK